MRYLTMYFIAFLLLLNSCKKEFEGDRKTQLPPETFTLVDSIYRDAGNLLTTTVMANWWGQSTSGFISGYEVSIDNQQTWQFTKNQAGTYLLSLPIGQQSGNLPIFVRAIDNLGQKDPTPAVMVFPVQNTAPSIMFDFSTGRKTSSLPAFRYNWIPADVDGIQDIANIEIVLNDTNGIVLSLPSNTLGASFVATKIAANFDTLFQVYVNNRSIPQPEKLHGAVFDQKNYIYIRSVDKVGATSAWVKDSILLKKPISDFLMVNDYRAAKASVQNFYTNQLNAIGTPYNKFDVVQDVLTELPADVFTTIKLLEFYSKIVWYSDDPASSLSLAQLITGNFFQQGGRMFMILEIPNDFPERSPFLNFTPVDALVVPEPGTVLRMNVNETMNPYPSLGAGWPVLKSTSILSNARPFYTFTTPSGAFTYDSLYTANLLGQNTTGTLAWNGVANVMSKRIKVSTRKPDLVFSSLPLHRLNGNNNIDSLLRKVLIDELEF